MKLLVAAVATSLMLLPACSGSEGTKPAGATPAEVMANAAQKLDETSGVDLTLTSAGLPTSASGFLLVGGSGTAIHPDSFQGRLQIKALGMTADAEVIATGGKVWINNALLGPGFQEVDPAKYGVPDPAQLLAPEGGIPDLLPATAELEEGESIRGGVDNKDVLTEYTGVLTQAQIDKVLGMGTGDFKVRYEVDQKGYLRTVEVTGVFYDGEPAVTYTVDITKYDVTKAITAP